MQWWPVLDVVLLAAVLVAPLAWLLGRRRWLMRQGGLFDCSMRKRRRTRTSGWVLGVARYSGEFMEWFAVFSLSFRPRVRVYRSEARVVSNRIPDYDEAAALYQGSQIVNMLIGDETCEFAMSRSSMTGLMSWLESAPPGHRYHPTSSDERSEL